jgi:hypothetical protein
MSEIKKTYKKTQFWVRRPLYLHNTTHEDGQTIEGEPIYKLFSCNFGVGNPEFLILTNHIRELPLGENEAVLEKLTRSEIEEYFRIHGIPVEAVFNKIHPLIESEKIYQIRIPITDEYLQRLIHNPEELNREITFFLEEGCRKDPKLILWGKSRLPIVSDDLHDHRFMSFRGHAFIVKNPKSGFSTLAQKLGNCFCYSSKASIRGWVEAKGTIHYGAGHGNFRTLTLDQASEYVETVLDVILTFAEQGTDQNLSAAYKFTNSGAPSISVVVNAGEEVTTPQDMLYALDKILMKVTTVPEAVGSREGLVIFDENLIRVEQTNHDITIEQIEENQLIIDSLFEHAIPKVKALCRNKEVQKWFNTPLPEYKENVLALLKGITDPVFGKRVRVFWKDHTEGYRHIRGVAFEVTIVDLLSELLTMEINSNYIKGFLRRADESLATVLAINFDSLRKMIEVVSASAPTIREIICRRYEYFKPTYAKALIFAYASFLIRNPTMNPKGIISLEQVGNVYNDLNKDKLRELFSARYSLGFATITQNLNELSNDARNKLCNDLDLQFKIDLRYTDNTWSIKCNSDDIQHLKDYIKPYIIPQTFQRVIEEEITGEELP